MSRIECVLLRTEDAGKLRHLLKEVFPDADFKEEKDRLVGDSTLERMWEIIDKEGIRLVMEDAAQEESGRLYLSKMAAFAGKVSLDESSPIGDITVHLEKD